LQIPQYLKNIFGDSNDIKINNIFHISGLPIFQIPEISHRTNVQEQQKYGATFRLKLRETGKYMRNIIFFLKKFKFGLILD
jgi:hypothetical protein